SSRRGNFREILKEVRWELDVRGYGHVKIVVSGGLSEEHVRDLRDLVDGFGVGTSISNAPVFDFSLDIVEVSGRLLAKRGKKSGAKCVALCSSCGERRVVLEGSVGKCPCGGSLESRSVDYLREGKVVRAPESIEELRKRVREEIKRFGGVE
ncbi:MAG: nicotinate phosphoribosyltransferase, partial [Deltaproteobacteria bacterium]